MARTESSDLPWNGLVAKFISAVNRQPAWLIVPVAAIVLIAILVAGRSSERETLLSGQRFRADELAAIEAAFARAGLNEYEIREGVIRVSAKDKAAYIRALEDADVLPRALSAPLQEALASSHFFESPAQRQARWKFAGEQELASYLRALDGIEDATVRFDEVREEGLQPKLSIRAMVVVKPTRGTVLVPEQLQTICELVAASRVGLTSTDVTVFDLRSGQTYSTNAEWTPAQRREQLAYRKVTYESHWNKKISELLTYIPRVTVATEVEVLEESLRPDRVHVVVTVPDPYYHAVWHDRMRRAGESPRTPTADELHAVHREVDSGIEQIINQLFAPDALPRPAVSVAITSVPDLQTAATEQSSPWSAMPSVVVSVVLLLVVGCAMALAGFLRDLVYGTAPRLSRKADAGDTRRDSDCSDPANAAPSVVTRIDRAVSEREELARLVRNNPAAAAATLRSWVDPTSSST